MKRLILLITAVTAINGAAAQDEEQYRFEIGGGTGMINYLGDYNGSLTGCLEPMGALLARYKRNPRQNIAVSVTLGKLKGGNDKVETWYPEDPNSAPGTRSAYAFDNSVVDVSARYELHFWAFGTGREYRGARRLAPYLSLGLGATFADGVATMNVPLGIGVKYKPARRLNIALDYAVHLSLSDKLDGSGDPYGITSSGAFKNTDGYSVLRLSLTYDIVSKCSTCHNNDD